MTATSATDNLSLRHARERRASELKAELLSQLPTTLRPLRCFACAHEDHFSFALESDNTFARPLTFAEAKDVFRPFVASLVESEHWEDGCVSTWPKGINGNADKPSARFDGAYVAEIKLESGAGYTAHELRFWVRLDGELCQVSIRIAPEGKWLPLVDKEYDRKTGELLRCTVSPRSLGEDSRRKWWSASGYSLSYYWADVATFSNFANL